MSRHITGKIAFKEVTAEMLCKLNNANIPYNYSSKEKTIALKYPYVWVTWYDLTKGEAVYELSKINSLYTGIIGKFREEE